MIFIVDEPSYQIESASVYFLLRKIDSDANVMLELLNQKSYFFVN